MSTKKRGLGRGLESLLSSVSTSGGDESSEELREIALDALGPGKHQPRRHFDAEALAALADSIRAQGVVQPIVVRPAGGNRYEIVAGERRWRAAKLAGLATVPAVVRSMNERGAMAVALVENIQRADLNALEEAEALQRLIKECGLTHDKTAEAVGRSRAHVTNLLRLIELAPDVQQLVREDKLSLGHAKVLLGVHGPRQAALAKLVVERHLSVRQLEAMVHAENESKPKATRRTGGKLEKELAERIGLPVRLQQNEQGRGRLTVSFRDAAELQQLLKRLN
ncbi:MAG TPA: ParB/RepB/Spo0J family partition protein [Solimonas sp.]|nr:ParB/RepB/Spo0J family partition protein [Solimonas sp.]